MNNKIGSVMVIGGGIGGMQAALDLAENGIKVYLVETKACIGGVMSQLDKTFPTNDCAMCTMAPRLVEIGRHKDIEIITLADVEDIKGQPGNFTVTLKKRARYINEEKCTGCGECTEKCPIEIPSEYNMNLDTQKAIYRRYPQAIPNTFAIKKLGQSPCRFTCPAGQKAQGYIALIREKRYEDAYRVILRDNPFPSVCGRICKHYCEDECTRRRLDEPVSIMNLKRFVADWAFEKKLKNKNEKLKTNQGKSVAIIGSGPAGLTAARDLSDLGYSVTIFESLPEPGGMMRFGVPEYRLPKERLQWDIENILSNGIELKTNHKIESVNNLLQNGFNAVFIALGTHIGKKLRIPGTDLPDVLVNTDFLRKVAMNEEVKLKEKILVLGGGNVAMDVARTAVRLGAKKVQLACLESRDKMPADLWEIEDAEKEGVKIYPACSFQEITSSDGRVTGVKCVKIIFRGFDKDGRPDMDTIPNTEHIISADTVIFAIGQVPGIPFASEGIELTKFGTIKVDEKTLATSKHGVFVGGDAVTGTKFIVDAIAAGHRVAKSIAHYLNGEDLTQSEPTLHKVELTDEEIKQKIKSKEKRHLLPILSAEERKTSFIEIQKGYTEEEALEETKRCLECGICSECLFCVDLCKAEAINHYMPKETFMDINVGSIIISPGYEIFDARKKSEYGYSNYPNVINALEFERILSASGPYEGKVLRPSDKVPAKKIAFVQCVGSRDFEHDYCSSICCMYATKEAIIAKEHAGENLECDIFFMDLRAFGKGFDAYYERAKQLGVKYIRCRLSSIEEISETKNLKINYLTEEDKLKTEEYNLVVLSVGLQPPVWAKEINQKFGIKLNEHGFCWTDPFKPVESNKEGIFVCGPFTEPKDIPETVTQASGAAAKALSLLSEVRGTLITPKVYPPEKDVAGQSPRIGVFICHCGTNIAGVVNVCEVVEYAKTLQDVVYAENNLYTCSNDTQEKIKKLIEEYNLNRVIVASCTPRTHEPLFRNTIREARLNPYLFEMANIRDQCSWVHMHEKEKATKKAKDLVRMAVAKVRLLEPLQRRKVDVNHSALVIGGGLSGMTAALEIAEQGYEVYLIEKEKQLGGNLRRIHYLFNGEKPQEQLNSLIEHVKRNDKIHLYTDTKISNIEGFLGNFKTKLVSNGNNSEKEINHGVVIVATGAKEYKPTEYFYGQDEKVITQLELEERLTVSGDWFSPTPNRKPRTVVMIQCVGSRNDERPYCSRVCCSEAVKNALKIKEINPKINVYILYRDMRTYGFRESYYRKAREQGVIFIRYEEDKKPEVKLEARDKRQQALDNEPNENNELQIKVFDPILQKNLLINTDLLVLSTATITHPENEDLSKMLKVPLTQDKFFLEAHMKLRPVDFTTEGVFLCGLAHSAKSIEESINQSCGVAARASTILSKDKIELEANISQVVDENCDGCAYCIDPCPYKAITLIEYMKNGAIKKTVEVDETACKGCGVCQATCPKKGIFVRGFKLEQISAMVNAVLGK